MIWYFKWNATESDGHEKEHKQPSNSHSVSDRAMYFYLHIKWRKNRKRTNNNWSWIQWEEYQQLSLNWNNCSKIFSKENYFMCITDSELMLHQLLVNLVINHRSEVIHLPCAIEEFFIPWFHSVTKDCCIFIFLDSKCY